MAASRCRPRSPPGMAAHCSRHHRRRRRSRCRPSRARRSSAGSSLSASTNIAYVARAQGCLGRAQAAPSRAPSARRSRSAGCPCGSAGCRGAVLASPAPSRGGAPTAPAAARRRHRRARHRGLFSGDRPEDSHGRDQLYDGRGVVVGHRRAAARRRGCSPRRLISSTAPIWSLPNRRRRGCRWAMRHRPSRTGQPAPPRLAGLGQPQGRRTRARSPASGSALRRRSRRTDSSDWSTSASHQVHRVRAEHGLGQPMPSPSWNTESQRQRPLLLAGEQVPRPRRSPRSGSGARRGGPVAAAQTANRSIETLPQLLQRHGADPGGCELDRQRQAVQPATTLVDESRGRARTVGRAARARRTNRAAPSAGCELVEQHDVARPRCSSGARLVVTTRRSRHGHQQEGHAARRPPPRRARSCRGPAASARCRAPGRSGRGCRRAAQGCAYCRDRSPSRAPPAPRRPRATTSSGEVMPTSSTKCTRAWVASRASTWAIRVLPIPPGPMIEVSRPRAHGGAQPREVVPRGRSSSSAS